MHLLVETVDGPYEVTPEEEFSFGRSAECTFCVDESDRNISRKAGTISLVGAQWVLVNTSANRPLHLTDESSGNGYALLPRHAHLLCEDRLRVSIYGSNRSLFSFTVVTPSRDSDGAPEPAGTSSTLGPPALTTRQREDLAALFWEYHAPAERRSPRPLTYAEAAARIGDTGKAVEHRIAHLRRKLLGNGYPAMELHELALFLMATKALQAADFASLEGKIAAGRRSAE